MFRKLLWLILVIAVGTGVHFALQGIIRSGDPELRRGPDIEGVARVEREDPARGAKVRAGMLKYESICRLCHHRTGIGGKFTPSLLHHNAQSASAMLRLYRNGQAVGPMTNLMAPWAKDLTEEEMTNLAEYIQFLAEHGNNQQHLQEEIRANDD